MKQVLIEKRNELIELAQELITREKFWWNRTDGLGRYTHRMVMIIKYVIITAFVLQLLTL